MRFRRESSPRNGQEDQSDRSAPNGLLTERQGRRDEIARYRHIDGSSGGTQSRLGVRSFFSRSSSRHGRSSSPRCSDLSLAVSPEPSTASIVREPAVVSQAPEVFPVWPAIIVNDASEPNSLAQDDPLHPAQSRGPNSYLETTVQLLVQGDDIWNSAFRKACNDRQDPEEIKALANTTDLCDLFVSLTRESQEHNESSYFQKGVTMVGPWLRYFNTILGWSDPVSNIEPCASSALAIAKLAITIGVAICGVAEQLNTHIETLLTKLPRIDCCDAVHFGRTGFQVQKKLVLVYKDLLDFLFYGRAILRSKLLRGKHFVLSLIDKSKLAESVSSFSSNIDDLDRLVDLETNEITRLLLEDKVDDKVEKLLDSNRDKEFDERNAEKQREDKACKWLMDNQNVKDWFGSTPGPKLLIMYGKVGCGKTVTVEYLVKQLKDSLPTPLVCSYYCKDDAERSNVRNVYRSLLSQLLTTNVSARRRFYEWSKEQRISLGFDPTRSNDALQEFLLQIAGSLRRQVVYIIIDALDECDEQSRTHLIGFLSEIKSQAPLVRVFVSARHDDLQHRTSLALGIKTIWLTSNRERDNTIVSFLTKHYMGHLSEQTCDLITAKIAEKTEGCAIWAKMALEYLKALNITKETKFSGRLEKLPPPQRLAEMYMTLFEKIVEPSSEIKWLVARSLEVIAASHRSLSLRELSYAVSIENAPSEKAKRLEDLEAEEDSGQLLSFIKPFVIVSESSDIDRMRIEFVHQSLKDVVMRAPPLEWTSSTNIECTPASRQHELNGLILQLCVDYLLLEEFGEKQLLPNVEGNVDEAMIFQFMNPDIYPEEMEDMPLLDPYERGFGGFYTYAACYWTEHYKDASVRYMPRLSDLISLSNPGSVRLKNWLDRMRRPDWNVDLEHEFVFHGYNPLALIVWFGSDVALLELLNYGLERAGLRSPQPKQMAVKKVTEHAIEHGRFSMVEVLLEHQSTFSALQYGDIFARMSFKWRSIKQSDQSELQLWNRLLDLLLTKLENVLIEHGSWILLEAARAGCLPMVQELFTAAAKCPEMERNLLEETSDDFGPIGAAGFMGHAEVVRFLCEQKGMQAHLHHLDEHGDNIYHNICRKGYPAVLRVLVQYFQDGVNQANGDTTPLQIVVNHPQDIEAARFLLLEGQADIYAGRPDFMPLRCAVNNGNRAMCRMLIADGKCDPWLVVGISEIDQPFLRYSIQAPHHSILQLEQEILREICSLMPLTVSIHWLAPATLDNETKDG